MGCTGRKARRWGEWLAGNNEMRMMTDMLLMTALVLGRVINPWTVDSVRCRAGFCCHKAR